MKQSTHFLCSQHLAIRRLGIIQEGFMHSLVGTKLAQGSDTVHHTLVGVFVNGHSDELGLADTDDRGHDQHGLESVLVSIGILNKERREEDVALLTSARRMLEAAESFEAAANLSTSFVKEAASTEPVKKSPPSKRAVINSSSAIHNL